jgi:hypothetical protein
MLFPGAVCRDVEKTMRLVLLIAAVLFIVSAPMSADTIDNVTCNAGGVNLANSGLNSASCEATYQAPPSEADAAGTAFLGTLSGSASVGSDECCANASNFASFDAFISETTTLTWDISLAIGGPYGYVSLDLGPLTEYYQENSPGGTVEETLEPGEYTFSAYSYVSDQGSASVSALTSLPSPVPEPSTFLLAAPLFLLAFRARLLRPVPTNPQTRVEASQIISFASLGSGLDHSLAIDPA